MKHIKCVLTLLIALYCLISQAVQAQTYEIRLNADPNLDKVCMGPFSPGYSLRLYINGAHSTAPSGFTEWHFYQNNTGFSNWSGSNGLGYKLTSNGFGSYT